MHSTPVHLGGHLDVTHVDDGALKWLKSLGVGTLLDVGCSVGGQVAQALSNEIDAYGLEGDISLLYKGLLKAPDRIFFSDLTVTPVTLPRLFDAIWCVEVAEHIEQQYLGNLLKTLRLNLHVQGYLIFTANSGPGINHVNLKPVSWWEGTLANEGFIKDEILTQELKNKSTMVREFIRNTGMVLTRSK